MWDDWHAVNGKAADDVSEETEDTSLDDPGMDDLALLLENDKGWPQDIGFVDLKLVEKWEQ